MIHERNDEIFHTMWGPFGWFQLDLASPHRVAKVIIDSRRPCCSERGRYLEVGRH